MSPVVPRYEQWYSHHSSAQNPCPENKRKADYRKTQ